MATAVSSRADIYRWDNGQLIPGTEGIWPGPGVQLDHRELEFASLTWNDLTNARLDYSNLTGARLNWAILTNADLSGAVVTGAEFGRNADSTGISKEQLYSTASYQEKNLAGVRLSGYDLNGWGFSGQVVTGAHFASTTLTKEQLYSTASYEARKLAGIQLALSRAQRAVAVMPITPDFYAALAIAQYRTGDHVGCIATLADFSSEDLEDEFVQLFAAMAHRQLGNDSLAHESFRRAEQSFTVAWDPDKYPDITTGRRVRNEAASLLGLRASREDHSTEPPGSALPE